MNDKEAKAFADLTIETARMKQALEDIALVVHRDGKRYSKENFAKIHDIVRKFGYRSFTDWMGYRGDEE